MSTTNKRNGADDLGIAFGRYVTARMNGEADPVILSRLIAAIRAHDAALYKRARFINRSAQRYSPVLERVQAKGRANAENK